MYQEEIRLTSLTTHVYVYFEKPLFAWNKVHGHYILEKPALVQVRAYLQGIIEEERSSISSLSFDGMGD